MSNVTLKINGKGYVGWKEVSIRRSMETAADSFELLLTDKWGASDEPRQIIGGVACEVFIGDEKIISGYVDEAAPSYNAKQRSVKVSGRSKVADIIDCSIPAADINGVQFDQQTLPQLAAALAKPFGINVVTDIDGFKAIEKTVIEQSQPVFEFIEERARAEAVLLVSNTNGDLKITRASQHRLSISLKLGENILSGSGSFNYKDRFSQYVIAGQQGGWNTTNGEQSAHISGKAVDHGVKRYRPTVIQAEDTITIDAAQRRAEWQRNVKYGRSRKVTYTVNGWSHNDGLWQPNYLVNIIDPHMGINDAWWMIASVTYIFDNKGQRVELGVMPIEAFDLVPIPLPEFGSW